MTNISRDETKAVGMLSDCQLTREELDSHLEQCAYGRNEVIFNVYFEPGTTTAPRCAYCHRAIAQHAARGTLLRPTTSMPWVRPAPPPPPCDPPPPEGPAEGREALTGYFAMDDASLRELSEHRVVEGYPRARAAISICAVLFGLAGVASTVLRAGSALTLAAGIILPSLVVGMGILMAYRCVSFEVVIHRLQRRIVFSQRRLLAHCMVRCRSYTFRELTREVRVRPEEAPCLCVPSGYVLLSLDTRGGDTVPVARVTTFDVAGETAAWTAYAASLS